MFGKPKLKELSPLEVRDGLAAGRYLLVDVREAAEHAAERIKGAHLFPLSSFDPHALPDADDKAIVFQCGSGKRSAMAVEHCRKAGLKHDAHMTGGIGAWKGQGLPTVRG